MIGRVSVIGLCSAAAMVLGGCAAASTGSHAPADKRQVTGAAASCAALTVSQQFSEAALIFDGTMLTGPTVPGTGGVLASPARMRVDHYVKGSGPSVVSVTTGVTVAGGAQSATEDGIQPHAGEHWQILTSNTSQPYGTSLCAGSRPLGTGVTLPLPEGAAWFSETIDTSPPTVFSNRPAGAEVLRKWLLWSGELFARDSQKGLRSGPGQYSWGDSEPGFGDWDALDVHTLPETPSAVMKLLRGGRLEDGQTDRAERTSPLSWLGQLAAMLADDPTTSAARAAAFTAAIGDLPGLEHLGTVRDSRGRLGVAVAETASNLHPVIIATGPTCTNPSGGAGCIGAGKPAGTYRTVLIYDPTTDRPLALRTIAVNAIPAARIKAGSIVYEVSYVQGHDVPHPNIPPPPVPATRTVQSVPWHLVRPRGRTITVSWSSGTCDATVRPDPRIDVAETSRSITIRVLVHVVTAEEGTACAGVGLGGTLSATLRHRVAGRRILHGLVTDRER